MALEVAGTEFVPREERRASLQQVRQGDLRVLTLERQVESVPLTDLADRVVLLLQPLSALRAG